MDKQDKTNQANKKGGRPILGKGLWCGLIFVVLLIMASLAGYLFGPAIIRHVLEDQLRQHLGLKASIAEVDIHPFSLSFSLLDAKVFYPDSDEILLGFDELRIAAKAAAIYKLTPVVGHARLVNPKINLSYHGGDRFSFSEIIERAAIKQEPGASSGRIFPMIINRLQIVNGTMNIDLTPFESRHVISQINLDIPFFSTMEDDHAKPVLPVLKAELDGSPLSVQGEMYLFADSVRTEFKIDMAELEFSKFKEEAESVWPLIVSEGQAATALNLTVEQNESGAVDFFLTGLLKLKNMRLLSPDGKYTAASFDSAEIGLKHLTGRVFAVELDRLALDGLILQVRRNAKGAVDWLEWFDSESPRRDAQAGPSNVKIPAEQAPHQDTFVMPVISAADITLRNSKVVFHDESLSPGRQIVLDSLDLVSSDFSSVSGGPVSVTGTFNNHGRFKIDSRLILPSSSQKASEPFSVQGSFDLKDISIEPIKPYLADTPVSSLSGRLQARGEAAFSAPSGKAVDFSLKRTMASLSGLVFNPVNVKGKRPFFRLDKLELNGINFDLKSKKISADNLTLKKPDLALAMQDGKVLWPAAGHEKRKSSTPEKQAGPSVKNQDWRISLKTFRVQDGLVEVIPQNTRGSGGRRPTQVRTDAPSGRSRTLHLSDLNIKAGPFSLPSRSKVNIDLKAKWQKNGSVTAGGGISFKPFDLDMRFDLERLALRMIDSLLGRQLHPLVVNGLFSGDMRLQVKRQRSAYATRARGSASFSNLALYMEQAVTPFTQCGKIDLKNYDYNSEKAALEVEQIVLDEPSFRMFISKDGNRTTISRLISMWGDPAQSSNSSSGGGGTALAVGTIKINNANASFTDRRTSPTMRLNVRDMDVEVNGLDSRSGKEPATFNLRAALEGAPLLVNGTLAEFASNPELKMQLRLDRLDLAPLSAYSMYYVAYPVYKGHLSLQARATLKDA